jgi:hypothetical protein
MEERMVEGLSGAEVIEDILDQIRRKLKSSCDLRDTDCYDQGYSGEVKISLKLYAVDTISHEFVETIPQNSEPPVSTEEVIVTPVEVDEKLEIPQELNIEAVRERSNLSKPKSVPQSEEDESHTSHSKRKYTRRSFVKEPAQGEAIEVE